MANISEKAISILAGNLNLGRSYLITTVKTVASNSYLHGLEIEKSNFSFWKISWSAENTIFCYLNHVGDTWKKIIQFGKIHELICHFFRLYLVPLPPYSVAYKIKALGSTKIISAAFAMCVIHFKFSFQVHTLSRYWLTFSTFLLHAKLKIWWKK